MHVEEKMPKKKKGFLMKKSRSIKDYQVIIYLCAMVLLSSCHFHTRIQVRLQIVMHSSSESHVYVRTLPFMCIKISFQCLEKKKKQIME
jgi:hypothetical protein